MKIQRLMNYACKDMQRAKLDVELGMASGRTLARRNGLNRLSAIKLGTISTYRNLKSSNNTIPTVVSGMFFFLPFLGGMPLGFVIGLGIKRALASPIVKKFSRNPIKTLTKMIR